MIDFNRIKMENSCIVEQLSPFNVRLKTNQKLNLTANVITVLYNLFFDKISEKSSLFQKHSILRKMCLC